jgi:hypothetical protein
LGVVGILLRSDQFEEEHIPLGFVIWPDEDIGEDEHDGGKNGDPEKVDRYPFEFIVAQQVKFYSIGHELSSPLVKVLDSIPETGKLDRGFFSCFLPLYGLLALKTGM